MVPIETSPSMPGMSGSQASRIILMRLYERLSATGDQILSKTSSEALHDYRVVVRKTRTLLNQLDGVLPDPGLSEFRQAFSGVMKKTSYLRDLEGCCSEFLRYKNRSGSDVGSMLDPLLEVLNRQEKIERRKVLKYLGSVTYGKLKSNWSVYLQQTLAEQDSGGQPLKRAWLPMQTVAKEAVRKSYSKTMRLAASCNNNMSVAGFHKLRKSYKKLRYLLDMFTEIFPAKVSKQIMRELKTLQGKLGLLQDTEVQLDILKSSVAQIEDRLDKSNKKAIREMIRYIKNKRKKARINAVESINKFTRYSAKKIDLLLC
jgi:CHAD domain-containing protein